MAYSRISTGHLQYDDITYPYHKIELETSIRYSTGNDTAKNSCTGQTSTLILIDTKLMKEWHARTHVLGQVTSGRYELLKMEIVRNR